MRFVHLSDLHFATPSYSPLQFFSKRWLGNANLLLFRKQLKKRDLLYSLPPLFKELKPDYLFLTGDVATTAMEEEFSLARDFVREVERLGIPVSLVPGNHDRYTRQSDRRERFYHYFPCEMLRRERLEVKQLKEGWWWIGLDCAHATSLFFSCGTFFERIEERLVRLQSELPQSARIVMGNHFPLFGVGSPRHALRRREALQRLLQRWPQVKLYLHGHEHTPYSIDRRKEGYPLILNAGSAAQLPVGGFTCIDVGSEALSVRPFIYAEERWQPQKQRKYLHSG